MDVIRTAYLEELAAFRMARAQGNYASAWRALERGHILSQRRLPLHLHSHGVMLQYALARGELGEAVGQVIRLALAPLGTITGRIPIGNTGRANVSAFAPMPVPQDVATVLDAADK